MSTAIPLGLGIVGAGRFATFLIDAVADLPDVEIRAVSDRDRETATVLAKRYDGWVCDSWQELVRDPDVDVVVIATPPASHAEIAGAALAPRERGRRPRARRARLPREAGRHDNRRPRGLGGHCRRQ